MGNLFILLILGYLCSFLYKTFKTEDINFNKSYLLKYIKEPLSYAYNKTIKFIRAQALYLIPLFKKIKKFILDTQFYNSNSLINSRKYLFIALIIHTILLGCIGNWIVFPKIKKEENWTYVEISTKDIEEKVIADSAPEEPNQYSEPDYVENSQENDSTSSTSSGIDIVNENIEVPIEAITISYAPVITTHYSKTKINFKPEESQEKINWGKQVLYNEGKIMGINGYGSDRYGSGLNGRGSGDGNGGIGLKEAKVFGTNIKAKKLGVIFDISYSMSSYTDIVEEEIRKSFPNAIVHYIDGCSIDPEARSIKAFKILSFENVDAVYWFCDLQDPQTENGLYILNELLKTKKIKLYVKSMDKHPNSKLKSIISSTGGNYSFGLN